MGLRLVWSTLRRFKFATPSALKKISVASFPGAEDRGTHDEVCRAIVYVSNGSLTQLEHEIQREQIGIRFEHDVRMEKFRSSHRPRAPGYILGQCRDYAILARSFHPRNVGWPQRQLLGSRIALLPSLLDRDPSRLRLVPGQRLIGKSQAANQPAIHVVAVQNCVTARPHGATSGQRCRVRCLVHPPVKPRIKRLASGEPLAVVREELCFAWERP
jgi:hypothetical protein